MSPLLNPTNLTFESLSLADLRQRAESATAWLLHGYLAPGNLTLLTSQWKAGKTTLLSVLLDRMKSGGELGGLMVRPGRAAIISEETPAKWAERSTRFDFADHVRWFCRPFLGRPSLEQWQALIGHLLSLHEQAGLSLVAIDPLASFLPCGSENHAATMLEALLPLQRLTSAGLAVMLLHHPRKKQSHDGLSARGSGALTGHVDVQMELHWYEDAASASRRRRLLAWSRHDETPRKLIIELSADGRQYNLVAEAVDEGDEEVREALWEVLERTMTKLTRKEILQLWPDDEKPPSPTALWGMLSRAVERGELKCDGSGTRSDPFYYWLPALEERWKTDPLAAMLEEAADASRKVRRTLPG